MHLIYTEQSRERLDKFLLQSFPTFSRTQIQKFIAQGAVTVNGKKATIHHWLKEHDVIEGEDLHVTDRERRTEVLAEPRIIDRTESYAIILKPAGLLMHPTEQDEDATLAHWLRVTFPEITRVGEDPKRPGIVHRLDKDVSGIVLVALDQASFDHFKGLFQEHTITKKYYCLVHGRILQDEGQIDTPIERSKTRGRMIAQSSNSRGKDAVTTFLVLKRFVNYTLLDVQILTGRTHQIRTHLSSIGHAIVGDSLYQTRDLRKKRKNHELTKPFLFAYYLRFTDQEGVPHTYQVDLPEDLQNFLKKTAE